MLKLGSYTLVGAETAQALPNAQVLYAFVRGAAKQYGRLWFGNVSVYTRFGYKSYARGATTATSATASACPCTNQGEGGARCGTSLSLMKRLMYSHLFYNSAYASIENGWFVDDSTAATLSPIGMLQHAALSWMRRTGDRMVGVHVVPIALLLPFNAGFVVPRHLYTDAVYRVWGNLPYAAGDFLADGALRLPADRRMGSA